MKRKLLAILLCVSMSVTLLVGCGTKDVDATNEEVTGSNSVKEENTVEVTKKLEEEYIERIEAYQEYYEQAKSEFSGKEVGATITLDKNGLPLMWLAISEDGTKDNCRTQLIGYVDDEATIKAERNEYIIPGFCSEVICGFGRDGERGNNYVWDDDKQDFRNIKSELAELSETEIVYTEKELEEKIEFLYPIYKGLSFGGSTYVVINESTSQVAYLGCTEDFVSDILSKLGVIDIIHNEDKIYAYFLKKDYANNKVALKYFDMLIDSDLDTTDTDSWWMERFGAELGNNVVKQDSCKFISADSTILEPDVVQERLNILENEGWERAGLSHPYANNGEMGQLLRALANKPIYSPEELYLHMVSILYNSEIIELNINDVQVSDGQLEYMVEHEVLPAYEKYVNENLAPNDYSVYNLIYIDNDDIPELLFDSFADGRGTELLYYQNGEVLRNPAPCRGFGFYYIPRGNRVIYEGAWDADVYGTVACLNEGILNSEHTYAENYDMNADSYMYSIDDAECTEEEYVDFVESYTNGTVYGWDTYSSIQEAYDNIGNSHVVEVSEQEAVTETYHDMMYSCSEFELNIQRLLIDADSFNIDLEISDDCVWQTRYSDGSVYDSSYDELHRIWEESLETKEKLDEMGMEYESPEGLGVEVKDGNVVAVYMTAS